ncbi:MAG: death-on-curing protein, partial [Eubacteriales bacterium]
AAEVEKELGVLLTANTTNTEKALDVFLWGARRQLFWDGNKRTSLLLANKLLVSGGNGMLTIAKNNMERFNDLLVGHYNTGKKKDIKSFLYENAISGIEFGTPEKKKKDDKER